MCRNTEHTVLVSVNGISVMPSRERWCVRVVCRESRLLCYPCCRGWKEFESGYCLRREMMLKERTLLSELTTECSFMVDGLCAIRFGP